MLGRNFDSAHPGGNFGYIPLIHRYLCWIASKSAINLAACKSNSKKIARMQTLQKQDNSIYKNNFFPTKNLWSKREAKILVEDA